MRSARGARSASPRTASPRPSRNDRAGLRRRSPDDEPLRHCRLSRRRTGPTGSTVRSVDAKRGINHGLEPLFADGFAAAGRYLVETVRDAPRGRLDLFGFRHGDKAELFEHFITLQFRRAVFPVLAVGRAEFRIDLPGLYKKIGEARAKLGLDRCQVGQDAYSRVFRSCRRSDWTTTAQRFSDMRSRRYAKDGTLSVSRPDEVNRDNCISRTTRGQTGSKPVRLLQYCQVKSQNRRDGATPGRLWQPLYREWRRETGPEAVEDIDVYLRTAVSVDRTGWLRFDYGKMPDYCRGVFSTPPEQSRRVGFCDQMAMPRLWYRDVQPVTQGTHGADEAPALNETPALALGRDSHIAFLTASTAALERGQNANELDLPRIP